MSTSTAPPSAALVAGKFQLLGLIGRGGMGSVWEGRHVTLGTSVAIKFIEKEYAESKEARARFDNEARAAATIQSKHAIQIFDHGITEDGKPFIVMELLKGEPLDKRLERLGRIPLQDVARTLNQVCRALQRAHDAGIVHRDLKPENIFLVKTPDDDDDVAKVLDFGIAKMRGPASGAQPLSNSTKTGAVLGTPYYMSPEQARGLRDIDHRTDLWSLGVIVFKCVTGVLPFEGESLGDLLVKICTTPVPIPSTVLPGLSHAFDAWFVRALDRDPQKRFATASELSDALSYACGISVKRGVPVSGEQQALGSAKTMSSNSPSGAGYGPGSTQAERFSGGPGGPGMATPSPTRGGMTPTQAAYGSPGNNVTSSPFTASTPKVKSSSGGLLATILITGLLVGAGVGVFAFVRYRPSNVEASGAGLTASPPMRPQGTSPALGNGGSVAGNPSITTPPSIATTAEVLPSTPPTSTANHKPSTTSGGKKPATKPTGGTSGAAAVTTKPVTTTPATTPNGSKSTPDVPGY